MTALSNDRLPEQSSHLRFALWGFAGLLLLIPAVAMQFTSVVNWGAEDFTAAALLLGGAGLGIELAILLSRKSATRLALIGGVVLIALLIWAELAVGIIR